MAVATPETTSNAAPERSLHPAAALMPLVLVFLGGLAAYRFFHLTIYPIYLGQRGADFDVFYEAAKRLVQHGTLYVDPGAPGAYIYPPTLALLLMLLAFFFWFVLFFLFLVVGFVALVVSFVV